MANIGYKWWFVQRDDNGFIVSAAVWVVNLDSGASKISKSNFNFLKSCKYVSDTDGNKYILLTKKELGEIKTDNELVAFCDRYITNGYSE